MNTVALITIHKGANFGSNLQTIATCDILKNMGLAPIVVNYIPPRCTSVGFFSNTFPNPFRVMWRLLFYPNFIINNHIYDSFLKLHCQISKKIYHKDNFKEICPKADFYIVGSDQVWNYKYNQGNDYHYFFDGIEGIKIAYASSIGCEKLPDEVYSYILTKLRDFKAISVREDTALSLVRSMGYNCELLIDPTLMLNHEAWSKYMSHRLIYEKYIFVYIPYKVEKEEEFYQHVSQLAKVKNAKIVTITTGYFNNKHVDRTLKFATPGDFLSLIEYAEAIITNSFHGTAFSINLEKDFWVFMPSNFTTRIKSTLKLFGLENRILSEGKIDYDAAIDYTRHRGLLNKERMKAIEYLKKTLG